MKPALAGRTNPTKSGAAGETHARRASRWQYACEARRPQRQGRAFESRWARKTGMTCDRLSAGHSWRGNLFFQLVNARYERGAMILRRTADSPSGARSSAIQSSPPRSLIACSTMPSSSKSKAQASACVNMPISCRSMFAPRPSSTHQSRHCRPRRRGRPPKTGAPRSRRWLITNSPAWGILLRHK
jgi:hypothetical protein